MGARIVPVKLDDAGREQIAQAAMMVAEGKLVAFPTETVYGIACNADDAAAVERLIRLKRRAPDKPFTIHIGRLEDAARHAQRIPPNADRLMRRYWPGPLTIVVPSRDGAGVGLRMPSNALALELLKAASVPVIAPSANRAGQPPATAADEVAATLGDDLDLILDGGPTRLQEPSTVVRVTDGNWEILREGSITRGMIRRTLATTIVFVCTANMCRSPMAEVLCKQMLAERMGCDLAELPERGYVVESAGVYAASDVPASGGAVAAMRARGLDLSRHASQPLTPSLLDDADVVFVMTQHHAASIRGVFPEAEAKVRLLDPTGSDIADPVAASDEMFRECAATIECHLREVMGTL